MVILRGMSTLTNVRSEAEHYSDAASQGVHDLALSTLKLLAVVEALPRCDEPGCGAPATRAGTIVRTCDAHSSVSFSNLPYAAALRALLST